MVQAVTRTHSISFAIAKIILKETPQPSSHNSHFFAPITDSMGSSFQPPCGSPTVKMIKIYKIHIIKENKLGV